MIVRVYLSHPVPLDNLSFEKRQSLLLMEQKNVDRIIFNEPLGLLTLYMNGKENLARCDGCQIEIINGFPCKGNKAHQGIVISK